MTPAERVDELVEEHYHHLYDVLDEQTNLIKKYILLDGTKALPRVIKHLNEFDPSRPKGDTDPKYWRFEACFFLLQYIDGFSFRLRTTEEGRLAINALERSTERMRAAGYKAKENRGNFVLTMVENEIKQEKGINFKDETVQNTFGFVYKIKLSDTELLDFSNYLTEHHPEYPSWSEHTSVKDTTDVAPYGGPTVKVILKQPERFYQAYLDFKKAKS